jgi:hypothetical protein
MEAGEPSKPRQSKASGALSRADRREDGAERLDLPLLVVAARRGHAAAVVAEADGDRVPSRRGG